MKVSAAARSAALALLGLTLATTAVLGGSAASTPSTAPYVDLARYDGKWYEIARLPSWFEKGCYGSTTEYTLEPDGNLRVVNSCRKGSPDGPVKKFEGKAWVVEPNCNSKLKVRFGWFVTSDYWIFDVSPDYSYCVIGTPDGGYLWIMSRNPQMDEAVYRDLISKAAANGFDTSRLEKAPQGKGKTTR